ncbi:MAG TPA: hypothetical protein VIX80_05625, partial [Candidatus Kapabacteria bacterium]
MHQLLLLSLIILALPMVSFLIIIFNQKKLNHKAHLVGLPIIGTGLALALYIAFMKLSSIPETLSWSTKW